VKSASFALLRAETVEEAVSALVEFGDDVRVIAGGQSLGPLMALRLAAPAMLVDLARVPGLDAIAVDGDGAIRLGAMVRQRSAEHHPAVAAGAALVAEAVPFIGHAAIRSQGTVCGSLAHADPAAELPAVALALGAQVHLRGEHGARTVGADDFFSGYYSTAVQPDELVESVIFPPSSPRTGTAFVEFSRRHGDFALVGVAAVLTIAGDGTIAAARLAVSGVASTPFRPREAESLLVGAAPTADAISAATEALRGEIEPGSDLHATSAYRRHLAGVLAGRALRRAADRAAEER
jgi:carbon-monoxide dehydrogenase medium subunit